MVWHNLIRKPLIHFLLHHLIDNHNQQRSLSSFFFKTWLVHKTTVNDIMRMRKFRKNKVFVSSSMFDIWSCNFDRASGPTGSGSALSMMVSRDKVPSSDENFRPSKKCYTTGARRFSTLEDGKDLMKGGLRRKYLSLIGLGAQNRCEQRHLTVPAHYL